MKNMKLKITTAVAVILSIAITVLLCAVDHSGDMSFGAEIFFYGIFSLIANSFWWMVANND